MANTLLTIQDITRESLRVLHSTAHFIKTINRQYDDRFAKSGAKIGTDLYVRLPNRYTVRTGAALSAQNTVNRKVTLPVATQKGVDMNFSSVDLTMKLEDFSKNIIKPAIATLVANVEADALSMYKKVGNYVGAVSGQLDFEKLTTGRQVLTENLAPPDDDRTALLAPKSATKFMVDTKGLFQSSNGIAEQYKKGKLGEISGFTARESTLIPTHTPGTHDSANTNGASQGNAGTGNAWVETSDIVTNGWNNSTAVLKAGDIITIADCFDVHPETKVSTGVLKRFSVESDVTSDGSGNATVTVRPAVIYGGAYQNVNAAVATSKAITVLGTAATAYGQDLLYHKDAFIFATADLEDVSNMGVKCSREMFEGISMRLVRQYDINSDNLPCRLDILYGYVAAYPELACRHVFQL